MLGISYLQYLMALPNIFRIKGETDKALKYSQEAMAIDVAKEFFSKGFHMLKPVIYNNLHKTINQEYWFDSLLHLSSHYIIAI